jgi:hypothetical protein
VAGRGASTASNLIDALSRDAPDFDAAISRTALNSGVFGVHPGQETFLSCFKFFSIFQMPRHILKTSLYLASSGPVAAKALGALGFMNPKRAAPCSFCFLMKVETLPFEFSGLRLSPKQGGRHE